MSIVVDDIVIDVGIRQVTRDVLKDLTLDKPEFVELRNQLGFTDLE
jgi:hypothetical protein